MFFMVWISKPSLFLQVCRLPPCFDDCHDGLFLVLCLSWPGSIMITPWALLVFPPQVVLSLWFLLGWSLPCGSSLVLSLWFLPGLFLVVPPQVVLSLWSPPLVLPCGSPWPLCSFSLSFSLSTFLMSPSALVVSDTPHMYIQ